MIKKVVKPINPFCAKSSRVKFSLCKEQIYSIALHENKKTDKTNKEKSTGNKKESP
jgi:hypothetical protein